MTSPRVLHVIPSLEIGGTERQLLGFVRRSSDPGRHRLVVFYSRGALAADWPSDPILIGRLGPHLADLRGAPAVIWRLRKLIARERFDLVHAHLGVSEILAAVAVPRSVPIVAARRGRNRGFDTNPGLKLLEGLGHRRADVLICNSRYWAEAAEREDRWTPPTRVIHNAIDTDEYPVARMPPSRSPHVVVVANLHPSKGHDRFLRSFRIVVSGLPAARATFVGDGVERSRIQRLVEELGLAEQVTFAGRVADPRPLVASGHVVALTSDHEGFPNALLEAMAQGRPVVATRVGGIPELVRDGVDGFLASLDPADIAARLSSLLTDATRRKQMGRAARERAETFTWDRLVRETEDVYRVVLARRRR